MKTKFKDIEIKEFLGIDKEIGNYYGCPLEFLYFVLVFKDKNGIQQQLSLSDKEFWKLKEEINKFGV